jgi:hypothetical protein
MNKDTLNLLTAAELKCENPDMPIFVLVEKCIAQKGSHDRWLGEIADVRIDKLCFIDDIIHLKSEHSDLENVEWEDVIVIEINPFA